ncbi:MAG TPA: DUF2779 domain-containing protein [Xanthomonadales bacterium]|nr:DUF2779 domain-containing protein [Xanthomonadales bacterium]
MRSAIILRMARLSKSRIMSSLQCLKRVHLEVHRPELASYSVATRAAFELGHQVGDIAVELYGKGQGEYIPYTKAQHRALERTRELLDGLFQAPVFEATLQHEGVLVREDVLLPEPEGWHIIEVKASTSLKPQYVQDCAIQAWVHEGAGYPFAKISLAHVDNQFVYGGDGDYSGMLTETDLTDPVRELLPSVPVWVEHARRAVEGPEPDIAVGAQCYAPYECPFVGHCWPWDSDYPVQGLMGSRKKLGALVAAGYRDLREVPAEELDSETHLRIRRVTRAGQAEILPHAGEFVRALPYPRYYLDFETVGPPVPLWPGTRPYQAVPFQWSCHIEREGGALDHEEFLDLSGQAPMRACAERLLAAIGTDGPVLVYTAYEKGVISGLAERFPDLAPALEAVLERLVDLAPVTKAAYYHPDMLGSWSLKAVLPTIGADLDYSALEGVHEGTEASAAYLKAIAPDADAAEVERVRGQLLEYCRYDTLALVELARFFARH